MEAILIPAAFGLLMFGLWKWIDPLNSTGSEDDQITGGSPDDSPSDGGDGGGDGGGGD
jgi:hypothetical protein